MINTYSRKSIKITIERPSDLGGGTFEIENAPINCQITKSGGEVFNQANIEVFGLELSKMNKLSFVFEDLHLRRMKITVQAGEYGASLPVVFVGEVMFSYIDLNNATPVLHIDAQTGCFPSAKKLSPKAFQGETPIQDIAKWLAEQCGYEFDASNPISGLVRDFIFNGDPVSMLKVLAQAIKAFMFLDDGKLIMIPKGQCRVTRSPYPVINKTTGMIGYPIMTRDGLNATTYFMPDLKIAERVEVFSENIPTASRQWQLVQLTHTLSANNPSNQSWKTDIVCANTEQL